jgi:hypothetical protein
MQIFSLLACVLQLVLFSWKRENFKISSRVFWFENEDSFKLICSRVSQKFGYFLMLQKPTCEFVVVKNGGNIQHGGHGKFEERFRIDYLVKKLVAVHPS